MKVVVGNREIFANPKVEKWVQSVIRGLQKTGKHGLEAEDGKILYQPGVAGPSGKIDSLDEALRELRPGAPLVVTLKQPDGSWFKQMFFDWLVGSPPFK